MKLFGQELFVDAITFVGARPNAINCAAPRLRDPVWNRVLLCVSVCVLHLFAHGR